ncbi:MAG: PIG-L deacetylase family protein [Limisphaerales bacterium]
MRLLFVHAHFDDYEFTAAGTFELFRRKHGDGVRRRVLVCTDGGAGHHQMSREETVRRRLWEQEQAAAKGGFEFRLLKDPEGHPFREARLRTASAFLPALWREIREFEPDYLFCPPIPAGTLSGVHIDHLDVAEAVRAVAYLINVPHAFSPEYPPEGGETGEARFVRTPVILNVFDGYMAEGQGHDLAVDVTGVADFVADLAWCHESQLKEWLPWVDRHNLSVPRDLDGWRPQFRELVNRRKGSLGLGAVPGLFEVFVVTAWGLIPKLEDLVRDFPAIDSQASPRERLGTKLSAWAGRPGE